MPSNTLDFRRKKRPKRGDGWIFVLLLFISAALWLFSKLNNEGLQQTYRFDLVTALPDKDKSIADVSNTSALVTVKGTGYELLKFHFFVEKSMDLTTYQPDSGQVAFEVDLWALLKDQLPNTAITAIEPATVAVQIERHYSKKVPVQAALEIKLAPGFDYSTPPTLFPDSVWIFGPEEKLADIEFIVAEPFRSQHANTSIFATLALKKSHGDSVFYEQNFVDIRAEVLEFTEKKLIVPIDTTNLRVLGGGKVIPPEVTVVCKVSLADYPLLESHQFRIIPKLSQNQRTTDFLTLEVARASNFAKACYLVPEQVAYIKTP